VVGYGVMDLQINKNDNFIKIENLPLLISLINRLEHIKNKLQVEKINEL